MVEYLKRERRPLTRENMAIQPEFLGLWQQEKDILDQNQIELFMPLVSRDHLIGILLIDRKSHPAVITWKITGFWRMSPTG